MMQAKESSSTGAEAQQGGNAGSPSSRPWLRWSLEILLALVTAGLILAMWLPGILWKANPAP